MKKKLKLSALLLLGFSFTVLQAQEAIPASGGDASGNGGTVSYSIGQVSYETYTGNGSLTQGAQQPYEIYEITGIEELIKLSVMAYPNPTRDFFVIKFENDIAEKYSYHLFDLTGKILESKLIISNETTITMRNLVPATYFLKVTAGNKEVKTFKIIKN